MNHVFKKAENRKVTMTDLEQAREALVRRGHPLGGVTVWEDLIRAVVAEMPAAEVPQPQSVAEPVKRMMRARGYDGMSYATTINTLAHHYDTEHEESEWCRKLGCKPFVEAEPETPEANPAKRMMRANPKKRGWPHGSDHAENSACEMGPPDVRCQPCEAEQETPAPQAVAVTEGNAEGDHCGVLARPPALDATPAGDGSKAGTQSSDEKRTVSAEARKKIVHAIYLGGMVFGAGMAHERADRIIAIIEADGAEASA